MEVCPGSAEGGGRFSGSTAARQAPHGVREGCMKKCTYVIRIHCCMEGDYCFNVIQTRFVGRRPKDREEGFVGEPNGVWRCPMKDGYVYETYSQRLGRSYTFGLG
jgi:hypothetical protein